MRATPAQKVQNILIIESKTHAVPQEAAVGEYAILHQYDAKQMRTCLLYDVEVFHMPPRQCE